MVIVLILTWVMALLIRMINPQEKSNLWYSRFLFFAGMGAMAAVIQEKVIPVSILGNDFMKIAGVAARFLSSLSYTFSPYCYLIFSLVFTCFFKNRILKRIVNSLFVLAILRYGLDFINPGASFLYTYPDQSPQFKYDVILALFYFLSANCVLLYSYLRETSRNLKQQKLLICILNILISLYLIITVIAISFGKYGLWRYNIYFTVSAFLFVIYCAFTYSIFGLKIRIEKRQYHAKSHMVATGTALLNHTFKSEIKKIEIYLNELRKEINCSQNIDFQPLFISIDHMKNIVDRIHEKAEEIIIYKEEVNLKALVDRVLATYSAELNAKNIQVYVKYDIEPVILCDGIHIHEVVSNIIKNSIEAMRGEKGNLAVSLYQTKKQIIIEIKDNGTGISPENVPYVCEPFFTTKKYGPNLGLGLSYCNRIIQEHKGLLEIESEKNVGTTVLVKLPKSKKVAPIFKRLIMEV